MKETNKKCSFFADLKVKLMLAVLFLTAVIVPLVTDDWKYQTSIYIKLVHEIFEPKPIPKNGINSSEKALVLSSASEKCSTDCNDLQVCSFSDEADEYVCMCIQGYSLDEERDR